MSIFWQKIIFQYHQKIKFQYHFHWAFANNIFIGKNDKREISWSVFSILSPLVRRCNLKMKIICRVSRGKCTGSQSAWDSSRKRQRVCNYVTDNSICWLNFTLQSATWNWKLHRFVRWFVVACLLQLQLAQSWVSCCPKCLRIRESADSGRYFIDFIWSPATSQFISTIWLLLCGN